MTASYFSPNPKITKLYIANDHAAIDLKAELTTTLKKLFPYLIVIDLGVKSDETADYPDQADLLAHALKEDTFLPKDSVGGLLMCGSGIGISIAANRHPWIRAALCSNSEEALLARQHNNANVLCIGARTTGALIATQTLLTFLKTSFSEEERHVRRINKL